MLNTASNGSWQFRRYAAFISVFRILIGRDVNESVTVAPRRTDVFEQLRLMS